MICDPVANGGAARVMGEVIESRWDLGKSNMTNVSVGSCQWAVVSGQLSVGSGQWAVGSGQLSVVWQSRGVTKSQCRRVAKPKVLARAETQKDKVAAWQSRGALGARDFEAIAGASSPGAPEWRSR
jgi:hypothetical protein